MATCFGLLNSEPSGDSMRVGLRIDEEVLRVTVVGGSDWDITLDRVRFIHWGEGELRLELAGERVFFAPEDPDAVVIELIPVLVAHHQAQAMAPALPIPAPGAQTENRPPDLTLDLTQPAERRKKPEARPVQTAVKANRGHAPEIPAAKPSQTRIRRVLVAVAVVAAASLVAVGVTQLGRSMSASEKARDALAAAGFESISVSVQEGTATLSGSVASEEEAAAARAAVVGVEGIEAVSGGLDVAVAGDTAERDALSRPDGPEPTAADASRALVAAGLTATAVEVEGGQAIVSGSAASELARRAATEALLGLEGINRVDNRLEVNAVEDDEIAVAAREALDSDGFDLLSVEVEAGVVTVHGVAPPAVLADGFFRFSDEVESMVLGVAGVTGIQNRLQLKGDEATLRAELKELTETSPVVFAVGKSELTAASRTALDAAAGIIQVQPGLRVLVAGHADTTGSTPFNEELSRARAAAVRGYLIEQGVAANRILIVAYGELFPSAPGGDKAVDRRVEFEVAA